MSIDPRALVVERKAEQLRAARVEEAEAFLRYLVGSGVSVTQARAMATVDTKDAVTTAEAQLEIAKAYLSLAVKGA